MGLFDIFRRKFKESAETPLTAEKLFEAGEACMPQDAQEAFKYYLRAANMGHAGAMKKVGHCYLYKGQGTPFDINQSAYWYKKAAENGDDKSMAMISWFYMAGQGVPQSDEVAKSWLHKATNTDDEKLSTIAKRELNEFETTKQTVTALFMTAIEMGGIPPKN